MAAGQMRPGEPERPSRLAAARDWLRRNPAPAAILILCILPELLLEGADAGLWGSPGWRDAAYENGAFWAGLLHGVQPLYLLQPEAMFVTYGFLHGGFWHVTLNMLTLVSLSTPVCLRLGQSRFSLLYAASLIGGGLGFGLMTRLDVPMVGASGALFGLAGAILTWAWADRRAMGLPVSAILRVLRRPVFILVLLNVVFYVATGGELAWQTHLGGFVAGAVAGLLLDRFR